MVGLDWSNAPESYAGDSELLVGTPTPDRSQVLTQTKRDTLIFQARILRPR